MKPADPIKFQQWGWPKRKFYKEQQEILQSVVENKETYVPAANVMGKDYVAGFTCPWFFLTRSPCKIVTTSASEDHLKVLWGEMQDWINDCQYPLIYPKGPLIVNHLHIKRVIMTGPKKGEIDPLSYIVGKVASPDRIASMQGHHVAKTGDGIPRTLFLPDECSSIPNSYYTMASGWFHRMLAIGNCWESDNSTWWKNNTEAGDKEYPKGELII